MSGERKASSDESDESDGLDRVAARFSSLKKSFAGMERPALDGVSGAVRFGCITGLVGPDGAGKTTLLRLAAGLLKPDSGSVITLGREPTRDSAALRLEVGYMPQKFGLYEDLTVWENLTLHANLRGLQGNTRDERFRELLDFTDLHAFTKRLAGKLSGGMKQKLGLACALLGKPKLLLLDEPGVGVDPVSRRELWRMVTGLVDDGMAVVWSTAYLDEAEACAETLVLHEGKLLFTGTPEAFTTPLTGRCWWLRNPGDPARRTLAKALARPEVCDGTVQGRSLRLTLHSGAKGFPPAEIGAPPSASWAAAPPRFEDAFIDRLGHTDHPTPVLASHLVEIPDDGAIVIEADLLTKQFGQFTAANQISFQVRRGEIFGLLGPNGAGKSTTFKMMCGLLTPSSGRAVVAGVDLRKSPSRARQKLGYMAQKFSLYGNLNVAQNLEFFAGIYGLERRAAQRQIRSMTEILHLGAFLNTRTDSLSLGYKQRLALACALMHEPEILFLDEPTSGVDPVTRREFWSHINGLVSRGVTVMVTTHFMDEAEYCDRIGLIYRGRWMAGGSPDDLKRLAAESAEDEPTMEEAFVRLIRGKEEP